MTVSSSSSSLCSSFSFLYIVAFFHLGSISEPSPAFLKLNLGPSFFCWAFHSSRVRVFISSSTGSFSSTPASSLTSSAGASPSTGASSTEVLAAVSSPSFASSSKVPQFPLPPPPRLSSALTPVLASPDFLSYSLFPPRPAPPPPSTLPLPPPSPLPLPPLPLPRPLPLPSPSSSPLLTWFPPSWFLKLFLSSLGPSAAFLASRTLFPSKRALFLWFSLSELSFLLLTGSFFTVLDAGLVASSIFLALANFWSASLCFKMSRGSASSSRKRA